MAQWSSGPRGHGATGPLDLFIRYNLPVAKKIPEDQQWYADGLQFTCTQCGNCCTGPPGYVAFTKEEADAIADYLGITVKEFRKRFTHKVFGIDSLEERPSQFGFDCIFLKRDDSDKAICSIYPVRPAQCRTWPFWSDNIESPRTWKKTQGLCPGSGSGQLYPVEEIRILRDATPKPL